MPSNTKYLFFWLARNRADIKVTWLTGSSKLVAQLRKKGYRACLIWSPKGIWIALRAGLVFTRQENIAFDYLLNRSVHIVNLWHGVGLKSVGMKKVSAQKTQSYVVPDMMVTTSDFMQDHFSAQFNLPRIRCPQLGYPRNDWLVDTALSEFAKAWDSQLGFVFDKENYNGVCVYAPTWRDTDRPFLNEAIPGNTQLNEILFRKNILLYVKLHGHTGDTFEEKSNIRVWPREIDIYPYFDQIACLITDYSSILYDYVALSSGRIILYVFDKDRYLSQDRSIIYDYDSNVIGHQVLTFDGLCRAFEGLDKLSQPTRSQRTMLVKKFFGGSASPASPAIVDEIESRLEKFGNLRCE